MDVKYLKYKLCLLRLQQIPVVTFFHFFLFQLDSILQDGLSGLYRDLAAVAVIIAAKSKI